MCMANQKTNRFNTVFLRVLFKLNWQNQTKTKDELIRSNKSNISHDYDMLLLYLFVGRKKII